MKITSGARRHGLLILAVGFTVLSFALYVKAAPARSQSLIDLPDGPALQEGKVIVNDGGPNPLQITVNVVGTTPNAHFQVQFEGRKAGVRFHYQVCSFFTDSGGSGGCHFNNNIGDAEVITGNAVALGPGER
jgi:hypothetical protein